MNSHLLLLGKSGIWSDRLKEVQNGFRYSEADSVKNLLETNLNHHFELVICNISGSFIDEITVINDIRKITVLKLLPVLIIDQSAIYLPENIKMAFKLGADDYLKSTDSTIELISRIENLILKYRKLKKVTDEIADNQKNASISDRLMLLMNSADNSFVIFKRSGEIEWVNEGFRRMYGYDIDQFKKSHGSTIFEASSNANIKEKVERCIQSKKSVSYVSECETKTGEYKWIQTTLTPVVLPLGEIDQFIAIETDITKLKETEEALSQKNEYMQALTNHLKSANLLLEEQQKEINIQNKALEEEREKSEELLLNILPYEVARQLKSKGVAKPRNYKLSTVLFLDFVDFTRISQELSPIDLVQVLDSYFSEIDQIVDRHFIEKIKTIGDAYLCAGGLPLSNKSNPFNVVAAALEIQSFINKNLEKNQTPQGKTWQCRIGIHTGSVIAGVVGKRKYLYDIWGNTVNIAARIQQQDEVGRINISGDTYEYVKDFFECEYRGKVAAKNCEALDMYFVNRLKSAYSEDVDGTIPNDAFVRMLNSL